MMTAPIEAVAQVADESAPAINGKGAAGAPETPTWSIKVGGGVFVVPAFAGAQTYRVIPLPFVEIGYKDLVTASVFDGVTLAIIRTPSVKVGPTVRYRFGQYERDARKGLKGLGDVDGAVEAGGTLDWERGAFGGHLYAGWDVGTGHKGGVAEASLFASGRVPLSRRRQLFVRVGADATLMSARAMRAFYGVDDAQSATSGFAAYRPAGGVERVGISSSATLPVSSRLALTLTGGPARLIGDAARSPRVRERGSRWQATLGAVLTYSF